MIRSTLENPGKRRRSWQANATPPRRMRVACECQGKLKSPLKAFAAFLRENDSDICQQQPGCVLNK